MLSLTDLVPAHVKVLVAACGLGVASIVEGAALIGQATGGEGMPGATGTIPMLTNLGAVTVLGWLAWHLATKAMPEKDMQAAAERKQMREEWRATHEAYQRQSHEDSVAISSALRDVGQKLSELAARHENC